MTFALHAIAAALAALAAPAKIQSGPMTLDQAIVIAQQNAFSIRLQQSNVEINRQRVAQAKANLGPTVNLGANYLRYTEELSTVQGDVTIISQPLDSKSATITANLPIDISGNLNRFLKSAKKQEEAARLTLLATNNDTRLDTRTAYFNVLRQQGLVSVAQQTVNDATEQLNQAKLLYQGEQIALVDVTRFEAQLKEAQTNLSFAQNNLELTRQQFNFTLSRPIETAVELAEPGDLPANPGDVQPLVDTASAQRPEVLSLNAVVQALDLAARGQEINLSPTLSVGIQHQRTFGNSGFGASDSTTFGTLSLNIPLYDSGLTRALVREARQNEEQAKINLEQLKLGISQEVRAAISNLNSSQDRLANAETQVKLAEEVYRLARVRQDAGAGTYVEVIDAETSLTTARNNAVTARYDYLTAYAQLQRAVGSDTLAPLTTPANGANK